MEDGAIIDLYWSRQESAITYSAEKYGGYCFSVAQGILSNHQDAEECVNDTWLRSWNAMPPQRPKVLRMFFARITRNLALDKYKARAAAKRGGGETELVLSELTECIPGGTSPEEQIVTRQLQEAVASFVRGMPKRDACVFVRRYFFTEPVSGIAQRYAMTEDHVYVILSRTRRKLKSHLRKEGYTL